MNPITLTAGRASVTIDPAAGGRLARLTVGGQELLSSDAMPGTARASSMMWGSFPMAPWAGRIRAGRFHFAGSTHQLGLNHRDGDGSDRRHAIHGTVFTREWTVEDVVDAPSTPPAGVTLWCGLAGSLEWPFGGVARQHIALTDCDLVLDLSVDCGDQGVEFPAVIGWHPWFPKPDRLEFRPSAMYRRDDCGLPTGQLTEPTPGPWDDCFLNTDPVVLHYDRAEVAEVTLTSDCDHWVVYDEPTATTCVEPQSGPPDAFNLDRPATVRTVTPGAPLRRRMSIAW